MTATIGAELDPTNTPDSLVEMLGPLCEMAAAWPPARVARERLVWAAVEHGAERRAQGEPEARIFDDYDELRDRVWRRIRNRPSDPGVASELILRFDSAISLAVAAALRGYYRDVIARSGEWPAAVERLLWDWRVTAPIRPGG